MRVLDPGGGCRYGGVIVKIQPERIGMEAFCPQRIDSNPGAFDVPRANKDLDACLPKLTRYFQSNALIGAGDECDAF